MILNLVKESISILFLSTAMTSSIGRSYSRILTSYLTTFWISGSLKWSPDDWITLFGSPNCNTKPCCLSFIVKSEFRPKKASAIIKRVKNVLFIIINCLIYFIFFLKFWQRQVWNNSTTRIFINNDFIDFS